jgi:hypothetical protein
MDRLDNILIDGVDTFPVHPAASQTYRLRTSVEVSFRLDSILLTQGSIVRDLGVTWLTVMRGPSDFLF